MLAMTLPRILAQLTASWPTPCLPLLLPAFPSLVGKRTVEVVLKAGCYRGASSRDQRDCGCRLTSEAGGHFNSVDKLGGSLLCRF